MKKFITTILAFSIGANSLIVFSQQANVNMSDSLNIQLSKIAKAESKPNWIKFNDDKKIDPNTVFIRYKSAFELKENDKMVLCETELDDLGFSQYHYQQYYKDVKIEGGEYIVHANKNGIAYSANGKLFTGIDLNVAPILNSKQAIDITLNYVNSKEYMWQSEFWEKDLKVRTGKPDTTFFPVPQLVIRVKKNKNTQSGLQDKQYVLAYRLDIYSSSPNYSQRIFIDANTGKILESFPLQSD